MRQYRVTLLSDVIIQQSSATRGVNTTLDFIPGANFMGIVASQLYAELGVCETTYRLFHSGEVRFGDANPGVGTHRCSRVPLSLYVPKFGSIESEVYVHHAISDFDKLSEKQLKQQRAGFYDFTDLSQVKVVSIAKSLALKSARNKETRSSAEGQMFCYQSMERGSVFYFEVDAPAEFEDMIEKALVGIRGVGRSRSAQYGSVRIERCSYQEPACVANSGNEVVVYADSRLVFLDAQGLPTCQPIASDFGISDEGAQVDWTHSQVRQFSYAQWNFKRQCFDAELVGIEKGSVFVIKGVSSRLSGKAVVGDYKTLGMGCVLYNPAFLQSLSGSNGQSILHIKPAEKREEVLVGKVNTPLLKYLRQRQLEDNRELDTFRKVNDWVLNEGKIFVTAKFASQWGQIRALAMQGGTKQEICDRIMDYLGHGVAKPRWEKFKRSETFMKFISEKLDEENVQMGIINLASEMAKKCKGE